MGDGRASPSDWAAYASVTRSKSASDVYAGRTLTDDLDPKKITTRESRDSKSNPNSTPLIIGLDMTGSMSMVLEDIMKKDLGVLFEAIYDKQPIPDPHILLSVFDDVNYVGPGCLQATQFEAEINPLTTQMGKIYLTRMGGGNDSESYHLPLYFAAKKTSIDSMPKRKKKGYIFTMGDEQVPPPLTIGQIELIFGIEESNNLSYEQCLRMAEKNFDVFHIMIGEGSHMRHARNRVIDSWTKVLGQRAFVLDDHSKLGEVIVSAIEVNEGRNLDDVAAGWSGDTAVVVRDSLKNLVPGGGTGTGPNSVVTL